MTYLSRYRCRPADALDLADGTRIRRALHERPCGQSDWGADRHHGAIKSTAEHHAPAHCPADSSHRHSSVASKASAPKRSGLAPGRSAMEMVVAVGPLARSLLSSKINEVTPLALGWVPPRATPPTLVR